MENSEELKPCPFCGGEARIACGKKYNRRVFCTECGALSDLYDDEPAARAAWNRRAPQAANMDAIVKRFSDTMSRIAAKKYELGRLHAFVAKDGAALDDLEREFDAACKELAQIGGAK